MIYLCGFADRRYNKSVKRLKKQVKLLKYFKKSFFYNEKNIDKKFIKRHKALINRDTRGFGFWIWKPKIIIDTLKKIPENSYLLYIDIGCHVQKENINILDVFVDRMEKENKSFLVLQGDSPWLNNPILIEKYWTKGDVFNYFNVRNIKEITDTNQIQGTLILIKNNNYSRNIIANWLNICETNINLIDDSKSISDNFEEFIENRHDQSILSILLKKERNFITVPIRDAWDYNNKKFPIKVIRDKIIQSSKLKNLLNKFRKKINAIINHHHQPQQRFWLTKNHRKRN